MADPHYVGFERDYSDKGIFQATISRRGRDETVFIPLWLPLKPGGNPETPPLGPYFVRCRVHSVNVVFIELKDVEARLPIKVAPGIYKQDWDAAAKEANSLDCAGYDSDGRKLGSGGPQWPDGFIAPVPAKDGPTAMAKRLNAQSAIWRAILTMPTTLDVESDRLWKPSLPWTGPPLTVYFTPYGAWPSVQGLQGIVTATWDDSIKKDASLAGWLQCEVKAESDVKGHVLLSYNLFRLYKTYISKGDISRLIQAQAEGNTDWKRPWPKESDAESAQQAMLGNLKPGTDGHFERLSHGLKPVSKTWISSVKKVDKRVLPTAIMGGTSAKDLAAQWWGSKTKAAEWLHRSALAFGELGEGGNAQSPDNIVFGTLEANSDMTRAEDLIRYLRDVFGANGTLTTTVVNSNSGDEDQLKYLDPGSGKEEIWRMDKWIHEKNYTWIAPSIHHQGRLTLLKEPFSFIWSTRFKTFSRYTPLVFEGKLDIRIFSEFIKEHFEFPKLTTGAKAIPTGDAASAPAPLTSLNLHMATSPAGASYSPGSPLASNLLLYSAALDAAPMNLPSFRTPEGGVPSLIDDHGPGTKHYLVNQSPEAAVVSPRTHTAWQSIVRKKDHADIGGVHVENPRLARDGNDVDPSTLVPPATGFMLEGTIKLFGLDSYKVNLWSWHGPPPADVQVGADPPVYQHVQVRGVGLAELIPLLAGTPLSQVEVPSVSITYQNYLFVKTCAIGWTYNLDIEINEEFGKLYDVLHNVLNLSGDELRLRLSASLGHAPSGPEKSQAEYRGVPTLGLDSVESMEYGFAIFGDMHIKVPGSVIPLELDFEIEEFGGIVGLEAAVRGDIWENAFGTGINLDMVRLSATFEVTAPLNSLDCSLSAQLHAESTTALVSGSFNPSTGYSVSAYVQDLGCSGVADLFRHRTGEELLLPSHVNVTIGSATISISEAKGLSITVDKLEFDHYASVNATLELSSTGALVQAKLVKVALPGGLGISLVSAYMKVSFERQGSGKSTDVALGGKVEFDGFTLHAISAGVHLYKTPQSDSLEWTVYGTFTDLGNTTTLGQLFPLPKVGGSFIADFALQDLMFIAASRADPSLSQLNPQKYPIQKGIQFSALFSQVAPLNKLLRRTSFPGLILSAVWASGDSFILDVVLPTNTMVHLGHGITTDPIVLSIDTEQLLLRISTGVRVPVPKSTEPLDFKAALTIKGESVKLEGEMSGLWEDPFGVSRSVSIGPFLELGVGIDLAVFPETGLPDKFSFAGGLRIGETNGQVAVQISENPSQELLSGKIEHFGIRDLVAFTREITELNIPLPPDFIDFQDIELYMSSGVTLGTVTYPAGFSFKAALILFGARLDASVEVSGGVLKANGSIDNLAIGPLHITGQHSKQAILDLQIGSTTQQLKVDGAIKFLGAYIGLTLNLEIMPKPTFSFNFTLHFTDLLTFMVEARMTGGGADLKHLSGLNFSLHALFEQHLVDHVREQVLASLETLKHRADAAIQSAELKVQREETKLQDGINEAKANLEKKYQSWVEHSKKIHADSQAVIDSYMAKLHKLQAKVDDERKAFNIKLKDAEGAVQHANANRAAKMRAAEAAVTKQKSKWDEDVAKAEKKLEDAKQYMHKKFGSAEADIEAAKRKVDGVQSDIDSTKSRIRYCENSHWYRFDLKAEIVYLGPKLGVLEGYKATADGILTLAEDIVKGADYLDAKAAIPAAEALVKGAGEAGDTAFRAAQATLREVDHATAALIHTADAVLESVRKGGDSVFRADEYALKAFIEAQKDLIYAAQHAIDDLVHSAEWLAYQTANGALSLAGHATHALDIAKGALEVAKGVADGAITVTEEVINAALRTFNITKVELWAELDMFLRGHGSHFTVSVEGEIVGKDFNLPLDLDMENPAQLILDIFHRLLRELKKL
ncbi:hypothetical protein FRC06_011055 [Ceratobasidium sp. 370]|nr:hypothetical protein FRC06_011055 [Ceratobasidium sp. 370]